MVVAIVVLYWRSVVRPEGHAWPDDDNPDESSLGPNLRARNDASWHVLVTVTERCTVLLFHFAISGQSGSGPRWGFIEVETTVGLPAAQSRPRMRAVPGADPFFVSRRSCGYQKPKRAILLCLSARHKRNKRHRTRKRKSHREIKRAPRGKWLGRRVRNGVDFGARWFSPVAIHDALPASQ